VKNRLKYLVVFLGFPIFVVEKGSPVRAIYSINANLIGDGILIKKLEKIRRECFRAFCLSFHGRNKKNCPYGRTLCRQDNGSGKNYGAFLKYWLQSVHDS
jgi:hypothetical protein